MKTIWKFSLTIAEKQTIMVPGINRFLHVGADGDGARCLWFAVDPESEVTEMEIITAGTGWELPNVGDYLGTINGRDGLVWHFFCGPNHGIDRGGSLHHQTQFN